MNRFIAVTVLFLLAFSAHAEGLRAMTEEWPPFNHRENGQPAGLAVEMVQAVLMESGLTAPVEYYPWNRAYAIALKTPDTLLFTMARSADREALFHWVFKVAPREIWLYRLSERTDIQVNQLDDAKNYKVGAGTDEDASTRELIKAGFVVRKNLELVHGTDLDQQNVQKLFAGRMDLLAGNPFSIAFVARDLGLEFSRLVPVLRLTGDNSPGYWVALSLNSDASLENRLRESAEKLEASGVFSLLREKYLGQGE